MAMDNYDDFDDTFDDDVDAPEESNNRTFLIIAGGLGLLVLCALIIVGGYIVINSNSNQTNEATAVAQATIGAMTVEAGLVTAVELMPELLGNQPA